MKIDEFDEWQGLTPQRVRDWLLANGWQQSKHNWWEKGADGFLFDPQTFDQVWFWLYALAAIHETNIQGMLREINPRMRKGMPSEAAINACPFWLVRDSETHEIELHLARKGRLYALCDCAEKLGGRVVVDVLQGIVMEWERLSPLHLKDFGDVMQFWPCDKHGNKVRWPTDADGKML